LKIRHFKKNQVWQTIFIFLSCGSENLKGVFDRKTDKTARHHKTRENMNGFIGEVEQNFTVLCLERDTGH
jgi:hypothetical protein